jgi:hypothetical protein
VRVRACAVADWRGGGVARTHVDDLKEVTEDVLYERFREHDLVKKAGGYARHTQPLRPWVVVRAGELSM